MPTVTDIYNYINEIAPFDRQEQWDNSGFLIGDSSQEVFKAMVALDSTCDLVSQAKSKGCQLIVTHHPVIFKPLKKLSLNSCAYAAANAGIAVISAHTSYDFADGGVSDILAQTLMLKNIRRSVNENVFVGDVAPTNVEKFALFVKETLKGNVGYCNGKKEVKTVAVCGGAGSDFIEEAMQSNADVYVTGEAHHHDFLDAVDNDFAIITAGHFETENISVKPLMEKLQKKFGDIEFVLANQQTPIDYI